MNKLFKKSVSLFLAALVLLGAAAAGLTGLSGFNADAAVKDFSVGDTFEFGSYPQSEVTDGTLLAELNELTLTWVSYGYYFSGPYYRMDYMQYADVEHNGEKYRAVTFSKYRPYSTHVFAGSEDVSYQDENGYAIDTVYWFKYEPLQWRVLDPSTGLAMCESIIDSQEFNNEIHFEDVNGDGEKDTQTESFTDETCTDFANSYAVSNIRTWLNDSFYNTAFSEDDKAKIQTTTVDNTSSQKPQYSSEDTKDKVFLLSYDEATNKDYGFSYDEYSYNIARQAAGTDYAKCQGLHVNTFSNGRGNSTWMLRSPSGHSDGAAHVYYHGRVFDSYDYEDVRFVSYGVRPALKLYANSSIYPEYTVTFHSEKGVFSDGSTTSTAAFPKGVTVKAKENPTRNGFVFDRWVDSAGKTFNSKMPAEEISLYARWKCDGELRFDFRYYRYDSETDSWVETYSAKRGEELKLRLFIDTPYCAGNGEVMFFFENSAFDCSYFYNTDEVYDLVVNTDPDSFTGANGITGKFKVADATDVNISRMIEEGSLDSDFAYTHSAFKLHYSYPSSSSTAQKISEEHWFAEFDIIFYGDEEGIGETSLPLETVQSPYNSKFAYTNIDAGSEGDSVIECDPLYDLRLNSMSSAISGISCKSYLYIDTGDSYIEEEVEIGEELYIETPSREGYRFDGWIDGNTGEFVYELPQYMPYEPIRLYAVWTPEEFTAMFDANGGRFYYTDAEEEYQWIRYGDYIEPPECYRNGYTFVGWEPQIPEYMPIGDQAFTAQWQPNSHKVTYYSGGEEHAAFEVDYEAAIPLPEREPEKEGYIFAGWSLEEGSSQIFDINGMVMPDEALNIYAVWVASEDTVYTVNKYFEGINGEYDLVTETYYGETESTVNYIPDEYAGFTFDADNENNVLSAAVNPDGSTALAAYYSRNKYEITIDENTYEYYYGDEISEPDTPEAPEGYAFDGWVDQNGSGVIFPVTVPAENMVLTPVFVTRSYTVTYYLTKGGEIYDQKAFAFGETISAPDVMVSGMTFNGWTDAYGNAMPEKMPASDIVLYASLTVNEYDVMFIIGGKTVTERVPAGSEIPLPDESEFEGYEFIEWTDASGSRAEVPEAMPANNLTFIAKLRKVLSSNDYGVTATFDKDCFEEDVDVESVELRVAEIEKNREPGAVYINNNAYNPVKLYNIKIVSGEKTVNPKSGKKVKIKIPVPEEYINCKDFLLEHRFSTKSGREYFTNNADEFSGLTTAYNAMTVENGFLIFEVGSFSEFELYVKAPTAKLKSAPSKTAYIYKEGNIDLSGIALEITNADGSTKTVTDTSKMKVTGFDSAKVGEQTVTVEYEGNKVEFKVTVAYAWWQWIIRILLLGFLWY